MTAKAVSGWRRNLANSSQLKNCPSALLPAWREAAWGPKQTWGWEGSSTSAWSNNHVQDYPCTVFLLHWHFKQPRKNKIELNYMRKKKSWVGANHQTSASEKLQTPPCSCGWVTEPRTCWKVLLGSTSPDSFAKPGEQQLHSLSKPEPQSFPESRQCERCEVFWAYPAPACSPWAAARLQVESCGAGKRETGELPDWRAGSAVLFKMLNQSFTRRGGRRGWLMVGRCLQSTGAGLSQSLAHSPAWLVSGALKGVSVTVRPERAGSCRVALPTREGSFEQICSNVEIMKFSIHPGC